jgi:hypothetical protein
MAKTKHARKKKYVNPVEQQRQQQAQYKRLFFEKLQNLCRQIGDASLYHVIPLREKEHIYLFRGAPLKVVAAPGAKIPKRMVDALTQTIKSQQVIMTLEVLKDSDQMMTFADYFLVGHPLEHILSQEETVFPGKERFDDYVSLRKKRREIYACGVEEICQTACHIFNDLEKKYLYTYTLRISVPAMESGIQIPQNTDIFGKEWMAFIKQDFRLHPIVTIGTYPLELRKIRMDDETHSVMQTGLMSYNKNGKQQLIPFTVSVDDLHINTPFSGLQLPVYIQQHALNRMKERIGFIVPTFYQMLLISALDYKEFIPIAANRLLMACFANNLKIGYFVAEIVDGIIMIRTFLLLTNSGTPEGNKLTKLTGLQIADHKYLSIDTLQGLANSDIEQNETICNLFREAGCGSILELCKKFNSEPEMMWLLDKSQQKNIIADLMTEYLKPASGGEEEYVEGA